MEILLLHPGGLGDIILSLPAVALLKKQFPGAGITFAANLDHLAPVAAGYADRLTALSTMPLHHLYSCEALRAEEVRFWKSFDRIVSWTGSGDSNFVRNLRDVHPDALIASWRPDPHEKRHVSQLFADSLYPWIPSNSELESAAIQLNSSVRDEGLRWLADRGLGGRDSIVALHPGAGSHMKQWPLERFISLAQRLTLRDRKKLLIIEGPAEPGLAKYIAQTLPASATIVAESIPLILLAAVLKRCEAFVGNDSGLAHLAAGLGVPSVVLFGPSLPQHWAPLGKHVVVLRDPRGCAACAAEQGAEHTCLSNISVDDVIRNTEYEITS